MKVDDIEKTLKIKFKNRDLLLQSLTHKSYDKYLNNEKLEFLGDRVLGFVIAKKLLELYPDEKEGILDKKLASLVNKKKCYEVGKFLQLNKVIKTNNSAKTNNNIESKIISDACKEKISNEQNKISEDGQCSWVEVECLGACVNAPMIQINDDYYEDLNKDKLIQIIEQTKKDIKPKPGSYKGRMNSAPENNRLTLNNTKNA